MSFRSNADAFNHAIREFRNNGQFYIERYQQWKK
jgi:ABC-type amino acid transport substrate-binding protein